MICGEWPLAPCGAGGVGNVYPDETKAFTDKWTKAVLCAAVSPARCWNSASQPVDS